MKKTSWSRWRQVRQPLLITTAGILVLIFIMAGLFKNIRRSFSAKQEINQIKAEIERVDKKNQEVAGLVDYLGSDEFLEEEARLKFDLRQPNDQIIVIKQTSTASLSEDTDNSVFDLPAPKKAKPDIGRNPDLWFRYFFANGQQK